MHALPTGTVTFLFTDIENSTKLWEAHSDTMQSALERHDALLRQAFDAAGGVIFKTVGDAFFVGFAAAPAALAAALEAQRALIAFPWPESTPIRVRIALHTGLAQERDRDYFGPVLNRVARLLSAGHGGQILLSLVTEELCRDTLPPGAGLRDLGPHRLKDLDRPEHVFQLTHPALAETFAPLRTLDTTPNNLPQQVTSFVGREKAIVEVTALLAKTRLLTLTGSGGSGKTRLALQAAAEVLDLFPDGAWQVELAPLADAALVSQTVAQVLGVKEQAGQTITQTLADQLKNKTLLLFLDNCEHLLIACAQLSATLLRSCPDVKILVSSREPLGIGGETNYRVPLLSLPTTKQATAATVASVTQFEAVRLFIERAQAVKTDFTVTNQNAPAVAQLCCRLDGIPLAIELAAARVRSLAVEQINDKLHARFRFLTGGDRSALPRQQTLKALVDWSYDLLTETEKTLFVRLSVFAGGWTLQAAETVCGFEPVEDAEVLDVLTSLADKSLIATDEDAEAGETRYRLLETLRQYGAEKRVVSQETETVSRRHAAFFVALTNEAAPKFLGPEQLWWLNRLETEHDNFRTALDWCAVAAETTGEENGETDDDSPKVLGLRLAGGLWKLWELRGYWFEGRAQLGRVLSPFEPALTAFLAAPPGEDKAGVSTLRATLPKALPRALNAASGLAATQGDSAAIPAFAFQSLVLSRALGDKMNTASALNLLGLFSSNQGDYAAARAYYEEGLTILREFGKQHTASLLMNLGILVTEMGDVEAGRLHFEEVRGIYREKGDRLGVATTLANLGRAAARQGDDTAAHALLEESVAIYREFGSKGRLNFPLWELGLLAYKRGDYEALHTYHAESIAVAHELDQKLNIILSLDELALALSGMAAAAALPATGSTDTASASVRAGFYRAAVVRGASAVLRESLETPPPTDDEDKAIYKEWFEKTRAGLGEAAFHAAWSEGQAMSLEQAVKYALRVG